MDHPSINDSFPSAAPHKHWHHWSAPVGIRVKIRAMPLSLRSTYSRKQGDKFVPDWLRLGGTAWLPWSTCFSERPSLAKRIFGSAHRGKERGALGAPPTPVLNEKELGTDDKSVSRGLSCDPDSCTGLCPGEERKFSSFISPKAEFALWIQWWRGGEADSGQHTKREMTLSFFHATDYTL